MAPVRITIRAGTPKRTNHQIKIIDESFLIHHYHYKKKNRPRIVWLLTTFKERAVEMKFTVIEFVHRKLVTQRPRNNVSHNKGHL